MSDQLTRKWTQLHGSTSRDFDLSISTNSNEWVYVAGNTFGSIDEQINSGRVDAFLSKYDSDGSRVWTRNIGSSEYDFVRSVSISADGSVFIVGYTEGDLDGGFNNGETDVFLSKYSSDGSKKWTQLLGSTSSDIGSSVSTSADGSVYIGGSTRGNLDGQLNNGGSDAFLAKYNSDGSKEWTQLLGTPSYDSAHSVSVANDGSIYITGTTSGYLDEEVNSGKADAFISKYNSSGTREWTKLLGSSSSESAISVSTAPDGSVFITGYTEGELKGHTNSGSADAYLSKFNSDGSNEWTVQLGSSEWDSAKSVSTSIDGLVYIVGDTNGDLEGLASIGDRDIFLGKYTSDGIKVSMQLLGSSRRDYGDSVSVSPNGAIYVGGNTYGNLTIK